MDELPVLRVMSLAQVGEQLGIHRSRVMLIERRALAKVRCALALEAAMGSRAQAILANLRGRPVRCYEAALRAVAEARRERQAITKARIMSQHGWCTKLPSNDGQLTDVWIAWSVPPTGGSLAFTNPRTRRIEKQLVSSAVSKWVGPTELPEYCTEALEVD